MTDTENTNAAAVEQPTADGARLRDLLEDAAAALEASASLPLFLTSDPTYRAVRLELANVSRMARSLRREPLDAASTYELGRVCTWHGRVSFAYVVALANGRNDDAFCQRLEEAQNALYEAYLVMFSRMADLADHWRNREHELAALTVGRRTAHELAADLRHYQGHCSSIGATVERWFDVGERHTQKRHVDLPELVADALRLADEQADQLRAELLEREAADRMAALGEATIINVDELRERHGAKRIAALEAELADARATIETLEQRLDVVGELSEQLTHGLELDPELESRLEAAADLAEAAERGGR